MLPTLTHLEVLVVEAHDLAVSKLLRGNEHDRQQLVALHRTVGLDLETLIQRCRALIDESFGDATEPGWALFHFVEEVWGEIAALDLRPAR